MGLVLFLLSPSPHSPHKRSHPLFCVHFHQISSYNGTHPTKDHRSVFVACYQAVHLLIYTDGLINAVYLIADKINVFSTLQWHPVTGSAKSMAYYHMFHFSHIPSIPYRHTARHIRSKTSPVPCSYDLGSFSLHVWL